MGSVWEIDGRRKAGQHQQKVEEALNSRVIEVWIKINNLAVYFHGKSWVTLGFRIFMKITALI